MKYLLRYSYYQCGPIEGGSFNPVVRTTRHKTSVLFHNLETLNNYIRLEINFSTLIKMKIERIQVE